MRSRESVRFSLVTVALVGSAGILAAAGMPDRPEPARLIAQVGQRVSAYYQRAQRLICIERSTVIPITSTMGFEGFPRTVESELRLEIEATDGDEPSEPRVTREVRRVNGREPRDRDRVDRSGCTDPTPMSPEPLAFLLPERREEFRFTAVREGRERNRAALLIDFAWARGMSQPKRVPELIKDEYGHDDCFDWKGSLPIAGRVWVDAVTYDVLRLERRLTGPTDLRVPQLLQRRYGFSPWVTIDRDDETIRYREVAFSDPDEVMLLPESIESVTVLRTGLQSVRRTQVFTDYRRFLTESRIRTPPE